MNKNTPWIALALVTLTAPAVHASGSDLLDESAFFVDIPEVTSATRMPQKLTDSPASITIIDRNMIEASGLQTIPDLLRLVPGFQSYLVTANRPATTYHGASDDWPKRLEVMIDGRSVYVPLLSTVDWVSLGLNIQDIERIEVVRGSNVPTQGSNAFLGSINIITRQPAASDRMLLNTTVGSLDTANAYASYANVPGTISYRISGAHEGNQGNTHESTLASVPAGTTWQDNLSKNYFNLNLTYTPNLSDTWLFNTGASRGYYTSGQLDWTNQPYDKRHHLSHYQSIQFNRLMSDTGSFQFRAYHNYLDLNSPLATVAFARKALGSSSSSLSDAVIQQIIDASHYRPLTEHGATHTYDAEAQLSDKGQALETVIGIGVRHESARSDMLLQQGTVSESRYRLFGNLGYDLSPKLKFNAGAMYEHGAEGSSATSYRTTLNFKPQQSSSIRLGYSSSQRLPSLLDRYAYEDLKLNASTVIKPLRRPDPNIHAEQIDTFEIGLYKSFVDQRGYFDGRIFREHISDAIEGFNQNGVNSAKNIGDWTNDGLEFQVKYQATRNFWSLFNYSFIISDPNPWIRAVDGSGNPTKPPFDPIRPMTPRNTASLMLDWQPTPSVNLSATHYYMSETDWTEGGIRDAYQRTDLRAAKSWHLDTGTDLELALIVQNAFEPTYSEFYRYNPFERRTYLQATLHFR